MPLRKENSNSTPVHQQVAGDELHPLQHRGGSCYFKALLRLGIKMPSQEKFLPIPLRSGFVSSLCKLISASNPTIARGSDVMCCEWGWRGCQGLRSQTPPFRLCSVAWMAIVNCTMSPRFVSVLLFSLVVQCNCTKLLMRQLLCLTFRRLWFDYRLGRSPLISDGSPTYHIDRQATFLIIHLRFQSLKNEKKVVFTNCLSGTWSNQYCNETVQGTDTELHEVQI